MPATPRKSKKARLRELLAEKNLAAIAEQDWKDLLEALAPISESYLRHLLAEAGVPVAQPYGGVRQKTFEDLEQSLVEMERMYSGANERGDRATAQYCRNVVIAAKDHARLAARSPKTSPEKKAQKEEMVGWMLVWLENPGVFPAWVKLRKPRI